MNNYKELKIWQKSMDLVKKVYLITKTYSLISQIQRSAVSIPSNIAEGAGRNSHKEFRHFLGITNGFLNEIITQFLIATRIGYSNKEELEEVFNLSHKIQKINFSLINKFSNI